MSTSDETTACTCLIKDGPNYQHVPSCPSLTNPRRPRKLGGQPMTGVVGAAAGRDALAAVIAEHELDFPRDMAWHCKGCSWSVPDELPEVQSAIEAHHGHVADAVLASSWLEGVLAAEREVVATAIEDSTLDATFIGSDTRLWWKAIEHAAYIARTTPPTEPAEVELRAEVERLRAVVAVRDSTIASRMHQLDVAYKATDAARADLADRDKTIAGVRALAEMYAEDMQRHRLLRTIEEDHRPCETGARWQVGRALMSILDGTAGAGRADGL